ncbi:MAG: right-handed parallel beta-helix repeat-containing protein [Phycisphaerales bacterium]
MPRKQKKRILRAKRRDWYKRLLDRRNAVSAHRPRFEELEPKMLLSGTTFYADDFTFADVTVDNGSGVLDAGDVVALTDFGGGTAVFGTDAFDTISAAISAAGADDIVSVGAGTFVEGPQIQISSNLDLVGQGAGVTIIEAGGNTTTSGEGRGWFLVDEGVNLNVSNMTFDGAGNLIWQAFRHRGSGTFDSVAFNDIAYQASGSPYGGTAIAAFGSASDIDVTNSSFSDIGRVGVLYFGSGVTGTFADNTYTGKGAGDWLDYALDISAGANIEVSGNTISNNLGVAISDGSTSAGVLVSTFFGAGTTADIHNNTLTGNTTGVAVGFDGSDTSSVTISGNDLSGNGNGVSSTAPTVDASGNWWGTNDEATIAGLVVGDVDFSPTLTAVRIPAVTRASKATPRCCA